MDFLKPQEFSSLKVTGASLKSVSIIKTTSVWSSRHLKYSAILAGWASADCRLSSKRYLCIVHWTIPGVIKSSDGTHSKQYTLSRDVIVVLSPFVLLMLSASIHFLRSAWRRLQCCWENWCIYPCQISNTWGAWLKRKLSIVGAEFKKGAFLDSERYRRSPQELCDLHYAFLTQPTISVFLSSQVFSSSW